MSEATKENFYTEGNNYMEIPTIHGVPVRDHRAYDVVVSERPEKGANIVRNINGRLQRITSEKGPKAIVYVPSTEESKTEIVDGRGAGLATSKESQDPEFQPNKVVRDERGRFQKIIATEPEAKPEQAQMYPKRTSEFINKLGPIIRREVVEFIQAKLEKVANNGGALEGELKEILHGLRGNLTIDLKNEIGLECGLKSWRMMQNQEEGLSNRVAFLNHIASQIKIVVNKTIDECCGEEKRVKYCTTNMVEFNEEGLIIKFTIG